MKKVLLSFALFASLVFAGYAQEEDKDKLFEDKKDTVSIDDMDPVFYEAEEEGKASNSNTVIIAVVAGVVVVAAGAFLFLKKKKSSK